MRYEYNRHQEPARLTTRKVKQQARDHHRSVTKEVIHLIEAGVNGPSGSAFELPPPLTLKSGYRPNIEDIEAAIAEGRD